MSIGERFDRVLGAARAGAESAWADLYRDLAPSLLAYLRAQGAHDPENVAGEVFLQVVRDVEKFEGREGQFRAWVFTIAHNRLVDERRRAARRPLEATGEEALELQAPVGDAEEDALRALAAERVQRVMGRLSLDQQTVLLLRILADLTVDEVASVIGKQPGAVKQLQRRGIAALRKALATEGVTL